MLGQVGGRLRVDLVDAEHQRPLEVLVTGGRDRGRRGGRELRRASEPDTGLAGARGDRGAALQREGRAAVGADNLLLRGVVAPAVVRGRDGGMRRRNGSERHHNSGDGRQAEHQQLAECREHACFLHESLGWA